MRFHYTIYHSPGKFLYFAISNKKDVGLENNIEKFVDAVITNLPVVDTP